LTIANVFQIDAIRQRKKDNLIVSNIVFKKS